MPSVDTHYRVFYYNLFWFWRMFNKLWRNDINFNRILFGSGLVYFSVRVYTSRPDGARRWSVMCKRPRNSFTLCQIFFFWKEKITVNVDLANNYSIIQSVCASCGWFYFDTFLTMVFIINPIFPFSLSTTLL